MAHAGFGLRALRRESCSQRPTGSAKSFDREAPLKAQRGFNNFKQTAFQRQPIQEREKERKTTREPEPSRKGYRQQCVRPTEVSEILPAGCACGCNRLEEPELFYIHQHIALPVIQPIVEHIILYHRWCTSCDKISKAVIPYAKRVGFGSRFSATVVELCAIHGDSRRAVQDYCQSVSSVPISQGGIQKIVDRA